MRAQRPDWTPSIMSKQSITAVDKVSNTSAQTAQPMFIRRELSEQCLCPQKDVVANVRMFYYQCWWTDFHVYRASERLQSSHSGHMQKAPWFVLCLNWDVQPLLSWHDAGLTSELPSRQVCVWGVLLTALLLYFPPPPPSAFHTAEVRHVCVCVCL